MPVSHRSKRPPLGRSKKCDIDALATIIGEKAFLMGDRPCGADATVFAFVAGFLTPVFVTPIRTAAEKHQNLTGYRDRILRHYFPQ